MSRTPDLMPAKRQPRANNDFSVYTKPAYYQDLCGRLGVTQPGDQVALMTMSFMALDPPTNEVLQQLCRAAQRGVRVTLVVDAHDFIFGPHGRPGPLFIRKQLPRTMAPFFQHNLQALKTLEASGGRYAIINRPSQPFIPSFMGRSHIKHAIINNRVYIGGCNLDAGQNIDMMIGWDDQVIAKQLLELTEHIMATGNARVAMRDQDVLMPVDPRTELLIDAGRPGQSLILSKALEIIDQAETSIYMTCQFFPHSHTVKHLYRAYQRGVKVELYYNAPSKHQLPGGLLHHAVLAGAQLRLPRPLTAGKLPTRLDFLHAKLLANEKSVIVGSHNYVQAGVDFGTAEIALVRHDAAFTEQAIQVMREQIT